MFRNHPAPPANQSSRPRRAQGAWRDNKEPDRTDYAQRHFVNLAATAFLLALAICIAWTIRIFDQQQTLERCVASGRKDCVQISQPPARNYRQLIH